MHNNNNPIHQLASYIKTNLSKRYTQDALKFSLISQGYSKITVERAIELANKQLATTAPIMKEKPQITYKIVDEENKPVEVYTKTKKSFWKKLFGQ